MVHSYPFCYRSETPLIYKAVPSWFVKVEEIKERLVANNQKTSWVPDFVKEKRFHNWLVGARDWAISRNRFWGTPIPMWLSDDGEEMVRRFRRDLGEIQRRFRGDRGDPVVDLRRGRGGVVLGLQPYPYP